MSFEIILYIYLIDILIFEMFKLNKKKLHNYSIKKNIYFNKNFKAGYFQFVFENECSLIKFGKFNIIYDKKLYLINKYNKFKNQILLKFNFKNINLKFDYDILSFSYNNNTLYLNLFNYITIKFISNKKFKFKIINDKLLIFNNGSFFLIKSIHKNINFKLEDFIDFYTFDILNNINFFCRKFSFFKDINNIKFSSYNYLIEKFDFLNNKGLVSLNNMNYIIRYLFQNNFLEELKLYILLFVFNLKFLNGKLIFNNKKINFNFKVLFNNSCFEFYADKNKVFYIKNNVKYINFNSILLINIH